MANNTAGAASLFQELLNRANTPVVPESVISPAVDALAHPKLNDSTMMAQLKGFGAGALEGARGLTTPMNLALAAIPGGRAGKGVVAGAKGLAGVVPELVQAERAVKQVMPMADDVTRLGATLKQRLLQVPSKGQKALGGSVAEFTPSGGEAAYNAGRAGMAKVPSPGIPKIPYRAPRYEHLLEATGEVSPGMLLGLGAAGGGAAYAGKKLYDMMQQVKASAQKVNPFQRYAEEMKKRQK